MIKPQTHKLGNLTEQDINFPKHLTPEIIHTALFIHNAQDKQETITRVKYCTKQIGEEAMSYAMALLVMPWLMEQGKDTQLTIDLRSGAKKIRP